MAELTVNQKHTIKATADHMTLTVEMDGERVTSACLEVRPADSVAPVKVDFWVEMSLVQMEDMLHQVRAAVNQIRGGYHPNAVRGAEESGGSNGHPADSSRR